jgi:hypothetical protein
MSDREKLVCKVCGLSYFWPGQAWKHANCKIDPPQVLTTALPPPSVEPAGAGIPAESTQPPEVGSPTSGNPASPVAKFNRSEVMKQRWAARKAKGKTVL